MLRRGDARWRHPGNQTSLTLGEAEHKLSELAEKGHLNVRAEGGRLIYVL